MSKTQQSTSFFNTQKLKVRNIFILTHYHGCILNNYRAKIAKKKYIEYITMQIAL